MHRALRRTTGVLVLALFLPAIAHAEIVEEIVALIDGDILTKSEYEQEEQTVIQEIYRRYAGADLDRAVATVRGTLLTDLIDRKILVHRAGRMFDTELMAEAFVNIFRAQHQLQDEAELLELLEGWGMTLEALKKRLINSMAPDEVVRFEVSSRVSVADHEVDAYYDDHQDEFRHEDEVTMREIVLLADTDAKRAERRQEIDGIHAGLTAETFAQVASELSEAGTKNEGGLLGTIKRGDLTSNLENVAFGLSQGAWSEVLETPYGFHILFAEGVKVGENATLQEVRPAVRLQLEDARFAEALRAFMIKARSESDWCVKEKYASTLPNHQPAEVCKEM